MCFAPEPIWSVRLTAYPFPRLLMKYFRRLPGHPLKETGKIGLILKTQFQRNFFDAPLADEQLMLCFHDGALVEQCTDALPGLFFQYLVKPFGGDVQFIRIKAYLLLFLKMIFQ